MGRGVGASEQTPGKPVSRIALNQNIVNNVNKKINLRANFIPGVGESKLAVEKSANESTPLPALLALGANGSDFLVSIASDDDGLDRGCGGWACKGAARATEDAPNSDRSVLDEAGGRLRGIDNASFVRR